MEEDALLEKKEDDDDDDDENQQERDEYGIHHGFPCFVPCWDSRL